MSKTLQILFTLTLVFALASITFTLGNTLTGSIILTRYDLGLHFSYMAITTLALTIIVLAIEYIRFRG